MAMGLLDRLRVWRAIAATSPSLEDPEVLAGRRAERFLVSLVQSRENFKGASLYPNKRVPAGGRRREIDLLVVTPNRIHVIEVKNWSGSLRVERGLWIQTNRNHREIEHPDLVADHKDKNAALVAHLRREGARLDPSAQAKYLSNKVVFMNDRLVVQDRAISEHPDVLLASRLDAYLNRQRRSGFGERVLGSIVQWCLDSESADAVVDGCLSGLAPDNVAKIRGAIDRLPTWDSLRYFGSRVECGDLIHVSVGGVKLPRASFVDRRAYPVRWTRNKALGLVKAVTGLGTLGRLDLPDGSRPLSPEDFVFFHRAGEPEPVQVPLLGLDAIILG